MSHTIYILYKAYSIVKTSLLIAKAHKKSTFKDEINVLFI